MKYCRKFLTLLAICALGHFTMACPGFASDTCALSLKRTPIETLGKSVEGKPILAYHLGEGNAPLVIMAGIHGGTECNTTLLANRLLCAFSLSKEGLPAHISLYIVPNINVDQNPEHCTTQKNRANNHGVDLNRNWDTSNWQAEVKPQGSGGSGPFSEPETRSLSSWLLNLKQRHGKLPWVISYHSQVPKSGAVLPGYSGSFDEPILNPLVEYIGEKVIAAQSGFAYMRFWNFYPITGEFTNWADEQGIFAWDIELPDRGTSPEAINNNLSKNWPAIWHVINEIPKN